MGDIGLPYEEILKKAPKNRGKMSS